MDTPEELGKRADVDFLDVCTFPGYRLAAVELGAKHGKHVLVQKPMAVDLETATKMINVAREAKIQLGVVSQHRFDDSTLFLQKAIAAGRLGRILQADAYVKWHRTDEYYARPVKGSWAGEGGGALISQAIHQVDVLLHLIGAVDEVFGYWHLGATHKIESEDLVCAVMKYRSGATGVFQAATALWPGYPERIEIHGTKGSAIVTGDQLTTWDVKDDSRRAGANLASPNRARPIRWRFRSRPSSGNWQTLAMRAKRAGRLRRRARKAIARCNWCGAFTHRARKAERFRSRRLCFSEDVSGIRGLCDAQADNLLIDAAGEKSSVDGEHFAGDKRSSLRSEEDGCASQFMRLPKAVHGRAHEKLLTARRSLNQRAVQLRSKNARCNRVHVDPVGRQFNCESFG